MNLNAPLHKSALAAGLHEVATLHGYTATFAASMLQKVLATVAVIGLLFVRGGENLRESSERSVVSAVCQAQTFIYLQVFERSM